MKFTAIVSLMVAIVGAGVGYGQVSGNAGYGSGQAKALAQRREQEMRTLAPNQIPPTSTSMFVEASVLMNVKADEFVAIFAVAQEAETLADCSKKMADTLKAFAAELKALHIADEDRAVDYIGQNKIYGFQLEGDILHEKLVGFEMKKNVSIRYRDASQIEKLTLAAAKSQIFDLIKVDYVVKDIEKVQDKLMDEAARIVKHKKARSEKLLDVKLLPSVQVHAERTGIHYPTQMYDSYRAFESEDVATMPRDGKYTVRRARKSSTFFLNALDASGFDHVVNPVVTEPVVQFTIYLKVKYEMEPVRAK